MAGPGLLLAPLPAAGAGHGARGLRGHGRDRRARGGAYLGTCRAVTTGFILKYCLNLSFAYLRKGEGTALSHCVPRELWKSSTGTTRICSRDCQDPLQGPLGSFLGPSLGSSHRILPWDHYYPPQNHPRDCQDPPQDPPQGPLGSSPGSSLGFSHRILHRDHQDPPMGPLGPSQNCPQGMPGSSPGSSPGTTRILLLCSFPPGSNRAELTLRN